MRSFCLLSYFYRGAEKLKSLTQSYRLTGKKTYKADAPLFAPACYLEGGKGQDNIRELTHLSLVDFDELFPELPPDITALNTIKPKLANDQIIYQPGKHNDYVMRVGYMLAKKRYAYATVLEWTLQKFPEYDGVEQVVKSCYKNTPGASEKSSGGGGGGGNGGSDNRFASVEEIRNFLDGHIRLRYNLITQRYEFLEIPEGASLSSDKPPKWQILLDRHVNSLWTKMSLTVKVNKLDMRNVIESDYTPVFNPFEECLKKWLVGMIAGWLDSEAVNNVILVYIGRQGANKTTWFNHLLPPELKLYFFPWESMPAAISLSDDG